MASNRFLTDITVDGKIGIETVSPTAPITVGKNVYGAENSEDYFRIKLQDQGGTHNDVGIGQPVSGSMGFNITSGGHFRFNNGTGGEIARFNGTGLGIGDTSPSAKLHVKSNSNAATGIHVENSLDNNGTNDSNAAAQISFEAASNNGYLRVHGSPTDVASEHQIDLGSTAGSSFITFSPSNSEKVRIAANGNVGIGTASPSSELEIKATTPVLTIQSTTLTGTTLGDKGSKLLFLGDSSTAGNGGEIVFAGASDTDVERWAAISSHITSNSVDGCAGSLVFATKELTTDTTLSEVMRITNSGRVGIGTASPDSNLHVNTSSGQANIKVQSATNDAVFFANAANNFGIWGFDNTRLSLATNGTERVSITGAGKVGIGTTSPATKLHVTGGVTINNFGLLTNWDSNDTDIDGLIDGSTFGGLLQGPSSGHFVLGLKDNDAADSFAVMSGSGNFTTDSTYDKLCFRVKADGTVNVGGRLTIATRDTNTSSTTALVMNGTEVEQRTLGSLAFLSSVTVTWDDITGDPSNTPVSGFDNDAGYLTSSNGMTTTGGTITSGNLTLNDNVQLRIGTGHDLRLLHNGTDSLINSNGSGDLYIQQFNDDKDIIFKNDDGSGGITEYFRLDGSNTNMVASKTIVYQDDIKASFGNSEDLRIKHDGSNSYFENVTGDLYIRNAADDKDIIFHCDDGSGGNAQYIRIDGSAELTQFDKNTKHADNVQIQVGNGSDGRFYHNGSNTYLKNYTGNLYIDNEADDQDIVFRNDNGSGGVQEYIVIDGSDEIVRIYKNTRLHDNDVLQIGSSADLKINHDGTDSIITNETGHLLIQNKDDDKDIIFKSDNGSGGVAEYFRVDGGSVATIFSKNTQHADNVKAYFGNAIDLQIYHDGSNSYIDNDGTGDLIIKNDTDDIKILAEDDILLRDNNDSTNFIHCINGGAVKLYHNGSERLETTSSGVALTDHLVLENNKEIRQKDSGGTERTVFELDSSDDLNIGGSYSGALKFIGGGSYTEQMRIHDDGNVGIGTTSPEARLHVYNGDAGSTTANVSHDDLIVENSGNVGIQLFGPATSYQYIAFGDPGSANAGYVRYDHNNNEMRFRVNGSDKVTIASDGDFGIGTTSPSSKLHVNGDVKVGTNISVNNTFGNKASNQGINFESPTTALQTARVDSDAFRFYFGGTGGGGEVLRILEGGNVGIGTTSPSGKLHVKTDASSEFIFTGSSTSGYSTTLHMDDTGLDIGHNSPGRSLNLKTDSSDRLTITGAGNVGIGTVSPSQKLEVSGNILASGDITAFSDERLKEDIKPLQGSLEKVQEIQGVSFVKKNDEDKKQKIGFIAQQLKEVLPEVVHENEDGIHSVAYGNITALLVEAVKEQQEIISQLEERIIDLENRL